MRSSLCCSGSSIHPFGGSAMRLDFLRCGLLAQIMDIGEYDDVLDALEFFGEERFQDVIAHAEPGWFRPRSWSYRHFKLSLIEPDGKVPSQPQRRFE